MERGMVRRPSTTESTASSGCDVTFDDVDDSQVFAYLDEGDEHGSTKSATSRTVEFRLDFSSRVNPAPNAVSPISSPPMSRRSSTNSIGAATKQSNASSVTGRVLQRSPSMRSTTLPFRKRLSRRPSEPVPDTVVAAAVAKSTSVRTESPPVSPALSRGQPPLPASVGPAVVSSKASISPTAKPSMPGGDDAMTSAHNAAMAAAAAEIDRLHAENGSLRENLQAVRSDTTELRERVRLAEQQNESLSDQLLAVQEAYEVKLQSAYDHAAAERDELLSQKESELQALRERSEQEREMLESEMKAAVTKIENDLQSDADQLQRLLRDGKEQTNALKNQIAALQAELSVAQAEKQQLCQSDASLASKCDSLQRSSDHWEAECQRLQDQVHQLLHEQDESRRRELAEKQCKERKEVLQKAIQERFALQVTLLQSQLKGLVVETRKMMAAENKKTLQLFARAQQQASELAIKYNEKAMALVAKQNRIIQLETQLKNERQSVMQLDASLTKTTRALQKKDECFRSKLQEQKEYLDITVAVRNGLTNELQNKKKKLEELEGQLVDVVRAKETAEKKNKHLAQQVKIMQHIHAREMEQVALTRQHQQQQSNTRRRSSIGSCTSAGGAPLQQRQKPKGSLAIASGVGASYKFSSLVRDSARALSTPDASDRSEDQSLREEDRPRQLLPEDDLFAAEEWREFVEIAALHEAECRHHMQQVGDHCHV